jgi:hypothetical protein
MHDQNAISRPPLIKPFDYSTTNTLMVAKTGSTLFRLLHNMKIHWQQRKEILEK